MVEVAVLVQVVLVGSSKVRTIRLLLAPRIRSLLALAVQEVHQMLRTMDRQELPLVSCSIALE